ncbi:uncharacterized protein LOC110464386 [Mizuhopecten yessoensis]|uniref:Beta-microseminoprotein n=1 Tax=Mizuhopecten yessoensis TaxID=6573 RepID=A0A210PU44_MIZYE|nr:uncharacterized protein LOC110464386 [Mizuhopecten yessoensis]OWF39964.1 hypothetical protein KP79_PYT04296 [Mizuhopecten yessoensis]
MALTWTLFLLGIFPLVKGYCFTRYGRVDETVSGRQIPVCEYNGLDILDGSSFRTAACMDCKCTNGLIECCGFGVQNETTYAPPSCTVISDGCEPLLVLKSNQTLACYTGRPIKEGPRPTGNPGTNTQFPGFNFPFPNFFPQGFYQRSQPQQDNSLSNLLLLRSLAEGI